jgi:hypothetical protein
MAGEKKIELAFKNQGAMVERGLADVWSEWWWWKSRFMIRFGLFQYIIPRLKLNSPAVLRR